MTNPFAAAIELINEERLRLVKICDNADSTGRLNYTLNTMDNLWAAIRLLDEKAEQLKAGGHLKPIPVTVTEDDIDDALEGPMDGLVKGCNICTEDSGLCFGTVKEAIIKMLREKGIGVTVVEAEGK